MVLTLPVFTVNVFHYSVKTIAHGLCMHATPRVGLIYLQIELSTHLLTMNKFLNHLLLIDILQREGCMQN